MQRHARFVTDDPLPHLQALIHRSAQEGADSAYIELNRLDINYSDNLGNSATIEFQDMDPDDIYAVQWYIETHYVPDTIEVALAINPGQQKDPPSTPARLPKLSEHDAMPPRRTGSGRHTVHLKDHRSAYHRFLVQSDQGLSLHSSQQPRLAYRTADTTAAPPQVKRHTLNALARPTTETGQQTISPETLKEISTTAMQMLADHARDITQTSPELLAWPDPELLKAMQDSGVVGIPEPPSTCQPFIPDDRYPPEILTPKDAVLSFIQEPSAHAVAWALRNHPEPHRRYNLVQNVGNSAQKLPELHLIAASAVMKDGAQRQFPVTATQPGQDRPDHFGPRLQETVMDIVQSITLTLEYNPVSGSPERFELHTPLYADSDHRHHVVLATPALEMGPITFEEITNIRLMHTAPSPDYHRWQADYQAARLLGQDPKDLNAITLQKVADALTQMGVAVRAGEETQATSKDGTLTLTLRQAQETSQ